MSLGGAREGGYDPFEDAVLAAMVASGMPVGDDVREWASAVRADAPAWRSYTCRTCGLVYMGHAQDDHTCGREAADAARAWAVPEDAPTVRNLGPLDDVEGNGRGPT